MTEGGRLISDRMINIARELSGAVTIEEALHIVIENAAKFYHHQSIALLVVNENTNALTIKNSRNLSYSFVKAFSRLARGNVTERVLMKHDTFVGNNLATSDPAYAELKLENDFKHICLVPIIQNQRAVGYLHCDRTEDPPFSAEETNELLVLGYVVGQQIEKHELLFLTRHLARIDEASKALKYHAFLEQYHREACRARTYGNPLTLMLFSIDNYTQYVKTCGIAAGHALLEEIFHIIDGTVREIDSVGRFTADEFIICLGGVNRNEAGAMMETIHSAILKQTSLATGCPIVISGSRMTFERKEDLDLPLEQVFAKLGSGLILARKHGCDQAVPAGEHNS